MSVPPEVLGPMFVARELVKAESALTSAQRVTEDRIVADGCAKARREIAPAVKRARLLLEAAGGTDQMDLEDRPNPGE